MKASLHFSVFCAPLPVKILPVQSIDNLCSGPAHFPGSHTVSPWPSVKYSVLRRLLSLGTIKVKLPFSLEISNGA